MRTLIALCPALLALAGCSGIGGSTVVTHATADGRDLIRSEVWIGPRVARFDCRSSASGSCHYVLYRDTCAHGRDAACVQRAFDRFAVASGSRRELLGLPAGFEVCVSERARPNAPGCASTQ